MKLKAPLRLGIITMFIISCIMGLSIFASAATTPTTNLVMNVKSSSFIYTKESATDPYKSSYVTFGEEVYVINYGSLWSKITYNGQTRYIRSVNLEHKKATVVKNRVLISKKAAGCTESTARGYSFYGDTVKDLGTQKGSNGTVYRHVVALSYYNADRKVKGTNGEGYINNSYINEMATPMRINGGTTLYNYAFGPSAEEYKKKPVGTITTGEVVECMQTNSAWAKIRYNGKIYFISANKVSPLKLTISRDKAEHMREAKLYGGTIHYLYWNNTITVLNTYESPTYGTYYFCLVDGDYGFIPETDRGGQSNFGFTNLMITKESTSLYKKADTASGVVSKINPDTDVYVGYSNGTWAQVKVNGKSGYMLCSKLVSKNNFVAGTYYTTSYKLYKHADTDNIYTGEAEIIAYDGRFNKAYIKTADGRKLYTSARATITYPSYSIYTTRPLTTLHTEATNSSPVTQVPYMTELGFMKFASESEVGDWMLVTYNDKKYYLWQPAGEDLTTSHKSTFTYTSDNPLEQSVIDIAMSVYALPTKYAHNQSNGIADGSGKYGFDCSGFAAYVLNNAMKKHVITYNLSANIDNLYNTESIYNKGFYNEFIASETDIKNIRPGDVLFFDLNDESDSAVSARNYNHCGVYLGNNEFIHASSSFGGGVRIMPLTGKYTENLVKIKRYLPSEIKAADQSVGLSSRMTNVYPEKVSGGTPLTSLGLNDRVTVLFTDNGNWAYVRYGTDNYGYVLTKYLVK